MREMQMQRLRMILETVCLRGVSRGDEVRQASLGSAGGRRGRVRGLLGREVSKILVVVPEPTPVVPIPVL
jgi:hypothetical protein